MEDKKIGYIIRAGEWCWDTRTIPNPIFESGIIDNAELAYDCAQHLLAGFTRISDIIVVAYEVHQGTYEIALKGINELVSNKKNLQEENSNE